MCGKSKALATQGSKWNDTYGEKTAWPGVAAFIIVIAVLSYATEQARCERIEVSDGLLSVSLEEAMLDDVLRSVGEKARVQVSIQGKLGKVQLQSFWNVPIAEGITRLVQNSNADVVMLFQKNAAGQKCLVEIRAYERTVNRAIDHSVPPPPPRIPTPAPPPPPAQSKSQ